MRIAVVNKMATWNCATNLFSSHGSAASRRQSCSRLKCRNACEKDNKNTSSLNRRLVIQCAPAEFCRFCHERNERANKRTRALSIFIVVGQNTLEMILLRARPAFAFVLLLCICQQALPIVDAQLYVSQHTYPSAQCSGTPIGALYFPVNVCTVPPGSPAAYFFCMNGVPMSQTYQGNTCTGSCTVVRCICEYRQSV